MSPAPPVQPLLPARGHHLPALAVVVVAVGLLLGLTRALAGLGLLAAVLLLQLGLVLAWVAATGIQGFAGSLAVGAAAAVAVDLALVLPERPSPGGLLAVLGPGFLAIVLQQMARGRPRRDLVASLAGGVLLVTVVAALGALLLLGRGDDGGSGSVVALAAVTAALVVGHLVDLVLPRPGVADGVPRGLTGLVLSVAAAGAVAWLLRGTGDLASGRAVLLGGAVGAVAALTAVSASYLVVDATSVQGAPGGAAGTGPRVSPWSLPVLQAVLPVAAAAPVALGLQTLL